MDTPRDNQYRFMKLMLLYPRMDRDLLALLRFPAGHPLPWLTGRRYARLDMRDPATQYPKRGNRMAALARLMFAGSPFDTIHLLKEVGEWLDFGDEDEERLYRCCVIWFCAVTPTLRPRDGARSTNAKWRD